MCKKLINNVSKEEMSREFKHQHKERLCYCCDNLQETEDNIHVLCIDENDRGCGSNFENSNVKIQLCDKCYKEKYEEWFNEIPTLDEKGYEENYKYENNIKNLINSFIIENQEYIWNHTDEDFYPMTRQDWIDMKKGILPDKKYKEYGMNSPSEIRSYQEKFPTCQYPVNVLYEDGSKGCWCPMEAHGEYGQKADKYISNKCYYCKHYKKRTTPIKDITHEEFENNQQYIRRF